MNNHFHLVVETPKVILVAGMKGFLGFLGPSTERFNPLVGPLFSAR